MNITEIWVLGVMATLIIGCYGFSHRGSLAARSEVEKWKDEFYRYKVHVAEHFASITYASAIEKRTVDALDEIKGSLKDQGQKIDRLIERPRA